MAYREPAEQIRSCSLKAAHPSVENAAAMAKALRTRDEWLRLAAQGSQTGFWSWNKETSEMFSDATTREMFGVSEEGEVTVDAFFEALHPDDVERVKRTWRDAIERGLPYETEYRARRPDGTTRWIFARGSGYYDDAGKLTCIVGVALDITKRKEIEQERLNLGGRLIRAQEEERSRLARELHDDFSQRVALVATKLQIILGAVGDSRSKLRANLQDVLKRVNEIAADVHSLSHSLHSSKLEILGLSRTVSSFCREFSKQYNIQIDFKEAALPHLVPSEAALSLFRVVQEGLQNVNKHSRASRVEVRLTGSLTEISLTLSDNGVGLDLSRNYASNGIGILSMNERARMLHGTFEIQSTLTKGTQITMKIPLDNAHAAV
jgi:PAS domain S-box-containing protein